MHNLAPIFDGPHYAVIFAAKARKDNQDRYAETAAEMQQLAAEQPGYLGIDSARSTIGIGITVSYWRDMEAIRAWRDNARHKVAQKLGQDLFYEVFTLRIARVEHSREWSA